MNDQEVYLGTADATPLPEPQTKPWNSEEMRENFRGIIAFLLIFIMASIIAASFMLFWIHPDRSDKIQQFFSLVFGPVVALVGAATGYYFGSQAAQKQ